MKLTKVRWVNLPPTAFVTSARPTGRPQTLAVSPFFYLPEPSIANRSTIDPEVVASFGFRSRNSATLGLATENGGRNPKNSELVPIVFCSIIIKVIVENLPISVENPPFAVEN